MNDLAYTLVSSIAGFMAGAVIGAWFGIPGITIGGIAGAWIMIFLLRRNENKHDDLPRLRS